MEVITVADLNSDLLKITRALAAAHEELVMAGKAHAHCAHNYRKAKAEAYVAISEGTIQARNALVDIACEQQRLTAYLAEARKVAALEHIRSLRAQLSALQSIGAGVRTEIEMSGSPTPDWSTPDRDEDATY